MKNYTYLEILVPYLNNPFKEAIFGSNKVKEEHETKTLQNEISYAEKRSQLWLMNWTSA